MKRLRSLTVFFPAYNDGGTIGKQVLVALETLPKITNDYEVLVVNDGSSDGTAEALDRLASQHPQVRVIHHTRNRGYGGALRSGFANARKDWVFYTDGDAQYDPREMLQLVSALRDDTDLVNGYKIARQDPLYRIVIGRGYHYFSKIAFGIRMRDVDCDFRLIRRSLLAQVQLESHTGTICVEMIKRFQEIGCRVVEVPVHHYARTYGSSQFFTLPKLCGAACQLVQLWWKLVWKRAPMPPVETWGTSENTLPISRDASI